MDKRSFLLSRAHPVSIIYQDTWCYDTNLQLNIIKSNMATDYPVCTLTSVITNSKTEAAPGDDDPDPEAEKCY